MLGWIQGISYIYFQINMVLSKDAEMTKMETNDFDITIDGKIIDTYTVAPTMDLVKRAVENKPDLERKYASQLPYFNTASIRNQLWIPAWDLITEGLVK